MYRLRRPYRWPSAACGTRTFGSLSGAAGDLGVDRHNLSSNIGRRHLAPILGDAKRLARQPGTPHLRTRRAIRPMQHNKFPRRIHDHRTPLRQSIIPPKGLQQHLRSRQRSQLPHSHHAHAPQLPFIRAHIDRRSRCSPTSIRRPTPRRSARPRSALPPCPNRPIRPHLAHRPGSRHSEPSSESWAGRSQAVRRPFPAQNEGAPVRPVWYEPGRGDAR